MKQTFFVFCRMTLFICMSVYATSDVWAAPKHIIDIQHWVSPRGMQVYFVHRSELPMLDIRLIFDAGSARDQQKPGLAQLTGSMLMVGTSTLNADQIAERFDAAGAVYGINVERDTASLSVRTLTNEAVLSSVLNTLHDVLTEPVFPRNQFSRIKNSTLQSIKEQDQRPDVVASKAFLKLLYGAQAYAYPILGSADSVNRILRDDLVQFHHRFYCAKNAKILLVGKITRAKAEKIVAELEQGMPVGKLASPLPMATTASVSKEQHIKFPSKQSSIVMGQLGINHHESDYFPLIVGNYVLGRSPLTSRLFREVRDKRGLAYSVYSVFYPLRAKGIFYMSLQTRRNKANEATMQVRKTLDHFMKQGITNKELMDAKKNITGSFVVNLASNSAIMSALSTIVSNGLPLDYLDSFRGNVNAVTRTQIRQAFHRHVHPDKMLTVFVGR